MSSKRIYYTNFLILLLLIYIVCSITITFAYFDRLSHQNLGSISIGDWIDLAAPATSENIEELIENIDTGLITGCNCKFVNKEAVNNYLEEILFEENEEGEEILSPLFEDYTVGEMVDVINSIRKFIANFLVLDENNNLVYPDPEGVMPMEVVYNWGLLPGEHKQVMGYLVLGNLAGGGTDKPVMLAISMENASSVQEDDLADFSIEVLIDQTPFVTQYPFPYAMTLRDREAWNDPILKNNIKNYQTLIPINDIQEYSTFVYRDIGNGNYQLKEYWHSYMRPNLHGNFRRFPIGLNYYLGKPKNSKNGIQQLFEKDNSVRPGFILSGKANGRKVEARVDIDDRRGSGDNLTIIPFVIVLSRGIEVGLANQKTDIIAPKIKIAVINGWVHEEYDHTGPGHSC